MRIHFSSGYSVQSHRGKVWHSCAFGSWWESLLLDFHSWKKKIISWCPQISWCTRGRERRWAVRREWAWAWVCGLIFLLARWVSRGLPAQGASREAPQDTGLQSPGWGLGTGPSSSVSATTPAHYPLHWSYGLGGCRTDGHQFTGKQRKAEDSTKRWPGAFMSILYRLSCDRLWRESVKDA